MMTNIELAQNKLGGKIWRGRELIRLYLKPDFKRNQTVYIEFDEILNEGEYETYMDGATLKVFTNCSAQDKWNVNASKQLKHKYMLAIAEDTGLPVCEKWEEVIL